MSPFSFRIGILEIQLPLRLAKLNLRESGDRSHLPITGEGLQELPAVLQDRCPISPLQKSFSPLQPRTSR
jgi:hypothetical protein